MGGGWGTCGAARAGGGHSNVNAWGAGRRGDGPEDGAEHGPVTITPGDTKDRAFRQWEALVPFRSAWPFKAVACEPFMVPLL